MTALLLVAALLAPPEPTTWVERDGTVLRATVDLRPWFHPQAPATNGRNLRQRLTSGLTTRLRFWLELRDANDALVGVAWRRVRVRWHLWDERFTTVFEDALGARTPAFTDVDTLIEKAAHFRAVPVASNVAKDEAVYRVVARLEVNPLSAEQATRMRRWLATPRTTTALDPLGGGMLGSFVRFFENLSPSPVEDLRVLTGPPFRADRLPYFKPTPEAP